MTLTLILLRHAKSGWDDPDATDHARTLTDRGQAAARRMGRWLAAHQLVPDLILCSDAMRTQQTVAALANTLGTAPQVTLRRGLYLAGPDVILRDIRKVQDAATLLVCGHNPGIGLLASRLVLSPPDHPRFADYPTAAMTVITSQANDWAEFGAGLCTAFVVPADLGD